MNEVPFDRVMLEIPHDNFLNHLHKFYPAMLNVGQLHEILRQLFDKMTADFRHYISEVQGLPNFDLLDCSKFTMEQNNELCETIAIIGVGLYSFCNQQKLFRFTDPVTFPYFLEHVNIGVACTYVYLHGNEAVASPFFIKGR